MRIKNFLCNIYIVVKHFEFMKFNKEKQKKEVLKIIKRLFDEAKLQFPKKPELSNRYVELARKAAMKVNLRIPKEFKRKFCENCYNYLVPGKNVRIRLHKSKIIYYCFNCRKYMRFLKR